tara:strand:- start:1535 stop:1945 length:411 start_codon:yes stop_codon:yes gene_type:complete
MNDYKTKEVDYSNQGKLYDCEGKTDMVLKRHGHMNIGQDYWRVYGIERKNQKNETILSLVVEIGTLKPNPNAKPELQFSDTGRPPDAQGVVSQMKSTASYAISSWLSKAVDNNGNENYFSKLRLQEFNDTKPKDSF